MKSFSLKALALAFIVVAGSAQAYWGEETINSAFEKISTPYGNLCGSFTGKIYDAGYENTAYCADAVLGFPYRHHIIARTAFALGVTAAAYKLYKHFTKPATDETVENANETTSTEAAK